MNKKNFLFDWGSFLLYFLLVVFGLVNIYSSTYNENSSLFNFSIPIGKQFIFLIISIFSAIIILSINSKFFERFSSLIYLISILLLIGLFIFGTNLKGATSWYIFGGIGFQPSEFAKVATALAIAKLLSEIQINIKNIKSLFQLATIITIPTLLIIFQPDPGSAIIFSAFFFVLYREGLNNVYLIIFSMIIILFILSLLIPVNLMMIILLTIFLSLYSISKKLNKKISFTPYFISLVTSCLYVISVGYIFNNVFKQRHRDRFNIILGKEFDDKGIGYNLNQSIIAIGSGSWTGKGFLQGTQTKGDFVPRQHTDYIFSTIGEEWGFLGCTIVIFIYVLLIYRILSRSEKLKNKFSRIFSYSFASILTLHFIINIGMSLGLIPTIGIPLPFISYGGSNLLGFTCMMFIYLNLDANRLD
ncbi:MAG: rod shape-determining protein RodA [Flavobacteriaceae bacterium]|nr:rod shape-determining protein RodA [Flavobacteriaceae bacterium]